MTFKRASKILYFLESATFTKNLYRMALKYISKKEEKIKRMDAKIISQECKVTFQ